MVRLYTSAGGYQGYRGHAESPHEESMSDQANLTLPKFLARAKPKARPKAKRKAPRKKGR